EVNRVGGKEATVPLGAVASASHPASARVGEREGNSTPLHASASGSSLVIPVLGVGVEHLTDTFAQARDEGERAHEALDIMAPAGAPVVAASAGKVERLFASREGGN